MAVNPRSGYISPDGSAYKTPRLDGQVDTKTDETYRQRPADTGIANVGYIPYGNVYERGDNLGGLGVYERPPAYEPPEVPDLYIESTLYPVMWEESMTVSSTARDGSIFPHSDSMSFGSVILSGTLAPLLVEYDLWPPESMDCASEILSGTLLTLLIVYDLWPPESMSVTSELLSGSLTEALIVYSNYAPESITMSNQILSGTLT